MTSYTVVGGGQTEKMAEPNPEDIENMLIELGLHALINNFRNEKITASILDTLNDQDLCRLGVTTIGDRLRLREHAKKMQVRTKKNRTKCLMVCPWSNKTCVVVLLRGLSDQYNT